MEVQIAWNLNRILQKTIIYGAYSTRVYIDNNQDDHDF